MAWTTHAQAFSESLFYVYIFLEAFFAVFLLGWGASVIFGPLSDKYGRVKTLAISVILFAVGSILSGIATNAYEFMVFRFIVGLGIGSVWFTGGNAVAEAFPENRSKKSIAIDLKNPVGQELLRKLAMDSDVIIENFRPGTMEKFGLSYEEARKLNRKIIYCSLSGYGQTGPSREWPGYDLTVLAYSGLLSLNAEEGRPHGNNDHGGSRGRRHQGGTAFRRSDKILGSAIHGRDVLILPQRKQEQEEHCH